MTRREKRLPAAGDYIDLELGTEPSSATYEFRRILKGVEYLFREAERDEETGLFEARLGIRLDDPKEAGKYDVMIIALEPSILARDAEKKINTILSDMSLPGARLWIADLATGKITAADDSGLIGKIVYDLGVKEEELKNALMRDLRTDDGTWHMASSVLTEQGATAIAESPEGQIAFYSERADTPAYGSSSILLSCIAFAVMYAVLLKVCLSGYTDEFYNTYRHSVIQPGRASEEHLTVSGGIDASGFRALGKRIADAWSGLTPGKKGGYTIELISILFLMQQIPLTSVGKEAAGNSVYYYISTGNWNRGPNLFALAGIVNLAAELLLGVMIVQMVLNGLALLAGTKGKTICRLISSFVRFIALFAFLILGFFYLGVDRATILTSVGSISLAVSLGAKDLISDLVSGIAIVFEGTFHVGEIVQISGCTGTVMEIGIRCTRLLERDGDIVTISNRNIGQIINMTQHNSWYTCEIQVSSSLDIEELESMLQEELLKIGEGDLRILSGPHYKGVIAFGNGTMTLRIATEYAGENYGYVRQKVNRELQRFFYKNGIQLCGNELFNQRN